jgi:hypothetical protein
VGFVTLIHKRHNRVTHASQARFYRNRVGTNGQAKAATPWGAATLVDELTLPQRAGEKRFVSVVQLLEAARGERLVRFAYASGGSARRGPVTLRVRDLERLREALGEHPQLAEVLRLAG